MTENPESDFAKFLLRLLHLLNPVGGQIQEDREAVRYAAPSGALIVGYMRHLRGEDLLDRDGAAAAPKMKCYSIDAYTKGTLNGLAKEFHGTVDSDGLISEKLKQYRAEDVVRQLSSPSSFKNRITVGK